VVQYDDTTTTLDLAFAAIADPTRRAVLERLGHGSATISELADRHAMTLTGIKKHVGVLESAGLVVTEKAGRTRHCRLGPRRLDDAAHWISLHSRMAQERLDRLGDLVAERSRDKEAPA
jgi:DNA-binding transcriptional ArsR family regulator